ncbi:MAG TPA: carboxypeptidase regulatory-like domain-containing protein [Terracidiphilus sp.]|nr:carboxypeptidase regulatory-like domain-containing protein [Terracidiphilus sp.]
MAHLNRCLLSCLVAATLAFAACPRLLAQRSQKQAAGTKGSLTGRLTDLNATPLAGATIVLRNETTGAEARTTTARNGSYRFAQLDAGEYILTAESSRGRGQVAGVVVTAGYDMRVHSAIRLAPVANAPQLSVSHGDAAGTSNAPALTERSNTAAADGATTIARDHAASLPSRTSEAEGRLAQPPAVPARNEPSKAEPAQTTSTLTTPAAPIRAPSIKVLLPSPANPAAATAIETESVVAYDGIPTAVLAALPAVPVSKPAPDFSSIVTQAPDGVQAMIDSRPIQLLPVAAAIAKAETIIPVLGITMSTTEVAALPATSHNWQNFALETPAGEEQGTEKFSVEGAPTRLAFGAAADTRPANPDDGPRGASEPINGAGVNGAGMNGITGEAWNGGRGFGANESGVRQVETIAGNVESEAARGTGVRIAVKTARAEDQIHGQGFLFDRQNTWGAQNPFTQWVENTGTVTAPAFTPQRFTPPDHEIAWGAGVGGHLRRNKVFWFAALDSYSRNDPGLSTVKLPIGTSSTGACAGFFCMPSIPQTQLLSAQLEESFAQASDDYLGIASGSYTPAGLEQLQTLLGPAPRNSAQWVGFGRIDWQVAERHRITLEGIGASSNAPGGGLTRLTENYGNHSYGSSEASEQWLLARWEAYLTPNLLATTQVSAGRDILRANPDTPSAFEQSLLSVNAWKQLPQIVVDSRYGFTIGNPSRFGEGSYPDEKLFHVEEGIDWVHNNLLVKAGVEIDHNADATSLLRNQSGTYYYSKVQNFISDALAFEKFGMNNLFSYQNPHNCNPQQNSLGALPCYSYFSQTMGPTSWRLSTTDLAGFATAQWQPAKQIVASLGLRWQHELLPPPIASVNNPQLPLTQSLPGLGNEWGPRASLAIGNSGTHMPELRFGYGMYYGRTENATLETALTQTGSLKGDLNFFIRPTDGMNPLTYTSDAPPFPYVLQGHPASVVKPGAVGFANEFRNPEVHQAVVSVEEALPSHIMVTAAAIASLARRLPVSIDTNLDHPSATQTITYGVVDGTGTGPIKAAQITVPFYASWPANGPGNEASCQYYTPASTLLPGRPCPDYQQISSIMSRANSTYEAAMVKIERYGRRGLSLHAHYTYSHAMDWNPNETTLVAGSDVLDPANFSAEYGVSDQDVRHAVAAVAIYETPWKMQHLPGMLGNGWMVSSTGQFRSGLPYTMRTSGSLPQLVNQNTGAVIEGLGPGMNGSGGDNRVYGVGRNTYRYPHTWKADMRLAKRFDMGKMRDLEIMAESFNLFNHQNVTAIETTGYYLEPGTESSLPTLNFLDGLKANTTAFGQPLSINGSDFFRERQMQFGIRARF